MKKNTQQTLRTYTFFNETGADIVPNRFLKQTTSGGVTYATASDSVVAVSMNVSNATAVYGNENPVSGSIGIVFVECAEAIPIGSKIGSNYEGKAVVCTSSNVELGYAASGTTKAGDKVLFVPSFGTPPTEASGATWGGITGTLSDQTDLQAQLDSKLVFLNGFDLQAPETKGEISFNNSTRTLSYTKKAGSANYQFWANNVKFTKTTSATTIIPNTTGTYYIYFDNAGVLQSVLSTSITDEVLFEYCLVALIYWNATNQSGRVGSEEHGIRMSSATHVYNHNTFGARYQPGGININGLVDGNSTYTETTSGVFWDEDIKHEVALQSTHPFMYKLGATGEWNYTALDNKVGYFNSGSNVVFNEYTGGAWQLTESSSSTDYMIYFMIAIPNIYGVTVCKLIGQHGYPNRSSARNAIDSEISQIVTDGLPSQEFIFLYAYIVRKNGTLENLAGGGTYVDLRLSKGGASNVSGIASIGADVSLDISNFDGNLSAADTNSQLAFETLDELTTITPTQANAIVANTAKVSFDTTASTKLAGIEAGANVNPTIASQAEAEAGTDNTKMMTPLATLKSIEANAGGSDWIEIVKSTDQIFDSTTAVDLTELQFSVESGKTYEIEYNLRLQGLGINNITTTGSQKCNARITVSSRNTGYNYYTYLPSGFGPEETRTLNYTNQQISFGGGDLLRYNSAAVEGQDTYNPKLRMYFTAVATGICKITPWCNFTPAQSTYAQMNIKKGSTLKYKEIV